MENCTAAGASERTSGTTAVDGSEAFEVSAVGAPGRRWLRPVAVALPVAGLMVFAFWRANGELGLSGSLAGIAVGGVIAFVGTTLRHRAASMEGPKAVTGLLASVFADFALFGVAALICALAWREAAAPVLLSALAVFMSVSFVEALASQRSNR